MGLIGRLDRVLRSAARLIDHLPKYASVSRSAYMRDVLHWLPVSQRISYRVAALVWRCLLGCAPSRDVTSVGLGWGLKPPNEAEALQNESSPRLHYRLGLPHSPCLRLKAPKRKVLVTSLAPSYTCLILVDLSLTSQLVDLCVLQKGRTFWSRELTLLLDSVEPFRLWVPPSGMASH